jgi:glycosyltransferase involved in cell wall biosynthesis
MMVINPWYLYKLLTTPYDVVHVVMPANLSGMWILAAFKVLRCVKRQSKPALVVSWHCNIVDYIQHFSIGPLRFLAYFFFFQLFGMLPLISDRILTPTRKSEPRIVNLWKRSNGKLCSGVCFTGVNKSEFSPDSKNTKWGSTWQMAKEKFLVNENKKYLLVCVGRLSPEKGVDELIKTLPMLKDCALWLVGDGPFRPVSVFVSVHCVDAVVQLELTLLCLILYHRSWKGLLVT